MMSMTKIFLYIVILLAGIVTSNAQRRIEPVENPATITKGVNTTVKQVADSLVRPASVVEQIDSRGNKIFVDTISGSEWVDTTKVASRVPPMIQPLLYSASLAVDVASPLMRAFGRDYGIAEIAAKVNLHNRYIPTLEIGLGQASIAPDDGNYHYHSPVAPFFRLGCDYNLLFNSNPAYQFIAGIRYGFAPFKMSVTDIVPTDTYWGDTSSFSIPTHSLTAGYLQVLLGVNVRIAGPVSLGWTLRYQSILHQSDPFYGDPLYIPGFGSRSSSLNFTFSIAYTINFHNNSTSISQDESVRN